MRISRLYTPQALSPGAEIALEADATHYLLRVLRLPVGQPLILFNGDGREYDAELCAADKKAARVRVQQGRQVSSESRLHTVLGLGISRGERMDYAIQKSTELGVNLIVPLFTEHCEVKLAADRVDKRLAHWQQIAISACEQCGRVCPPRIEPPQGLAHWLATPISGLKLLLDHTQPETLPQAPPEGGVVLLIGPEGGFAEGEMALAKRAGYRGISLGPRVLRTETAPVAALSVIQYLWGDRQAVG